MKVGPEKGLGQTSPFFSCAGEAGLSRKSLCGESNSSDETAVEFRTAFAALFLFLMSHHADARRIERIDLESKTMAELTVLLSAGDDLHSNLIKQDDEQIDVSLRDIELATRRTMSVSARLKPHERTHLLKNLESIDASVDAARNSGHTDRRERIADIFNTMANLVRVYSVDVRFKIFFCARDKMTWIQRKPAGRYPFVENGERECALRAP